MASAAKVLAVGGNPIPSGTNTNIYTAPANPQVARLTELWLFNSHTTSPIDVFIGIGGFQLLFETLQPKQYLPLSLNTYMSGGEVVFINPSIANFVNFRISGVEDVNG